LREQLQLLEDLQKLDLRLQETDEQLAALPAKLQEMKDDVSRVEAILEADRQRLNETQKYKDELQQAIDHDRDLLNKTKSKLAAVRTSKEYMAIQREFEANRKLTSEREEEIAKLNQAVDETRRSVEEREQKLEELQQHIAAEEKETEVKLRELAEGAESSRQQREEMSKRVKRNLLRKYDQIRKLRGGMAVVPADGGVCTGCRMQLPPQLYNILQRAESIEQCPNCQRIVFYPDAVSPPSDAKAESSSGS